MKRIISAVLAVALTYSLAASAFAADAKTYFNSAIQKTNAILEAEEQKQLGLDPTTGIFEGLFESANKMSMNVSINEISAYGESYTDAVSVDAVMKMDPAARKSIAEYAISGSADVTGTDEGIDLDINVYADDSQIALNVPGYSDDYFSLGYDELAELYNQIFEASYGTEEWEGQFDRYSAVNHIYSFISAMAAPYSSYGDQEQLNAVIEDYTDTVAAAFDGAVYAYAGTGLLNVGGNYKTLSKVTATLSAEQFNALCRELAGKIENDAALQEALSTMLGSSMSLIMGTTEDPGTAIAALVAEVLYEFEASGDLVYAIYVDENDRVLSRELIIDAGADSTIVLRYSTKGTDYLMNDVECAAEISTNYGYGDPETYGAKMAITGNTVPYGRVYDGTMKLSVYQKEASSFTYGAYNDKDIFAAVIDYSYDAKLATDNFEMSMVVEYNESALNGYGYSATITPMSEEEFNEYYSPMSEEEFNEYYSPITEEEFNEFYAPMTEEEYNEYNAPMTEEEFDWYYSPMTEEEFNEYYYSSDYSYEEYLAESSYSYEEYLIDSSYESYLENIYSYEEYMATFDYTYEEYLADLGYYEEYTYEQYLIEIEEHNALYGENGSGGATVLMTMDASGSIIADAANGKVAVIFDSCNMTMEDISISMSMAMTFEQADASEIVMGNSVNLMGLSLEELQAIMSALGI